MSNVLNRRATKEDIDAGLAVFCVPGERSRPYDLGAPLPVSARIKHDIGKEEGEKPVSAGTIVEVVQCEIVDEKEILVGFRQDSDEGVCALEEIEILGSQT
jgi:hypothetical protein